MLGRPASSIVENLVVSDSILRAARINAFVLHRPTIDNKIQTHLLVYLSWFKFHPKMLSLGKPLSVWCPDIFELEGVHSNVPVQFVKHRAVSLISNLAGESFDCMSVY